jgi:hypothetical protein
LIIGNLLVLAFGVIDVRRWVAPTLPLDWISIHDVFIFLIACAGALLIMFLAIREAGALGREDPPPRSP